MAKLNIGARLDWKKEGWITLDHNALSSNRHEIWNLPYKDETFDVVFCSHVFEHIPHFRVEKALAEVNRILKPGGIFRIIVPDLKLLAKAYLDGKINGFMEGPYPLGIGQEFMRYIVNEGVDNYILNSDCTEFIAGYGHVFAYDREMMKELLLEYGFWFIRQCTIHDSDIEDHKELRTGPHDEYEKFSLVMECKKSVYIPYEPDDSLMFFGSYNIKTMLPRKWSPFWLAYRILGKVFYAYLTFRRRRMKERHYDKRT